MIIHQLIDGEHVRITHGTVTQLLHSSQWGVTIETKGPEHTFQMTLSNEEIELLHREMHK